jgi:hypothetical protein
MNHSPLSPLRRHMAVFAAAFGLALLAVPAAHAFTFEDKAVTNSDGSRSSIADPDDRLSRFGTVTGNGPGSPTTVQQGNTTFQFGPAGSGSFNQRYNSDRMFQPIGRPEDR